jgi:diguanylate cyclase (GGDEF)-like protein
VLGFFLATSVLNILLGVGLGLLVVSRAKSQLNAEEEVIPSVATTAQVDAQETAAACVSPSPQPGTVKFVMEDLSPEWLDKLQSECVQAKSLVEASTLVLRLEVGNYRENLVKWEYALRRISDEEFAQSIREPIASIVQLNEEWLKIQAEAVNLLAGKTDSLGEFRELSQELEEILLGQTSQIESTANNLLQLRTSDPPAELRIVLTREIQRLIDLAHRLRDSIQSTLLAIFVAERRIDRAEKRLTTDSHTQLLSPIGLEAVFDNWRQADPSRKKTACVGLLSLNQFKNLNEALGTRHADCLLASVSQLCAETIRKDRGFDRIARIGGDTLAIFYGDTSIRSCVAAMERLRQTLQQSKFIVDGAEIVVSGTCAVAAQIRAEAPAATLRRVHEALQFAKSQARDQLTIDEGNGPEVIEPPRISIRPARIEVAPAAID